MNDAQLILDIGADVSQFNASLDSISKRIKSITKEIESSTGTKFAELSFKLTGLERTQDTLLRFGQFAEGTLGALINQIETLNQERLELKTDDTAKFEEYGKKIDDLITKKKQLLGLGKEKIASIIEPAAIDSIQYFNEQLNALKERKAKVVISTKEGRAEMMALNSTIQYYEERIKEANALGKTFDPIPQSAIGSINYFNEKINSLKSKKATISVNTAEGRIQIAELVNEIEGWENKLKEAQSIGKSTQFIDLNTIAGLQARLNEINALVVTIDVTDEGQIAALNTEAIQLREQIARLQGLSFDSKGILVKGAAKARQSLVNLGLVAQDLPFGFIAIQNNIPNLVQSFSDLSIEAKKTGVSVGSQLAAQFKGTAGAIFGVGLGITALTATVTYFVQKYGSLEKAFDALFGKIDPLAAVIKRADKALKDFGEDFKTVGESIGDANSSAEAEIVTLEALGETILDVSKTERARKSALEQLKSVDEDRFARYDIESGKLEGLIDDIRKYTNAVIAKSVAEKLGERTADALAAREIKRNLYGEQIKQLDEVKKRYPDAENGLKRYKKALEEYAQVVKSGGLTVPLPPKPELGVEEYGNLVTKLKQTNDELIALNDTYVDSRQVFKNATLESLAFGKSLKDVKDKKIKFDYDLPKIEEFLQIEKFFDPGKSLDRLDKYADVLLDVNAEEKERINILKSLETESLKATNGNFKLFQGLDLTKLTLSQLTNIVDLYAIALQDIIIKEEKLFAASNKFQGQTSISEYIAKGLKGVNFEDLETDVIEKEFEKIKELSKGLPKELMPSFEEFKRMMQELLTLESFKTTEGTLGLDQVTALTKEQLAILRKTIEDAKVKNALAKIFGDDEAALTVDQNINNIINTIAKVKEAIASSLEKPFREFFDTLLETGKVSFKSFLDLFKDVLKRIASQLIASGIANLITSVLFPQAAVGGALTSAVAGGGAGGATGILKFLGKIFGIGKGTGAANFSGVESSGMQLAGQVVFTQRGSDLVGVLNRTNGTINRVG